MNGHVYPEVEGAPVGDHYRQETLLFRNLGNGKFSDLTATGGPALQAPRISRGLALGDLDEDGRPEAVILNMNDLPSVLKNTAPGGHFLNLRLTGTKSNRSAIGARVTLRTAGNQQTSEVMSGASFYSQNSFTLHFGLGAAKQAETVTVRWPSGKVDTWKDLSADAVCQLTEGRAAPACQAYSQ